VAIPASGTGSYERTFRRRHGVRLEPADRLVARIFDEHLGSVEFTDDFAPPQVEVDARRNNQIFL